MSVLRPDPSMFPASPYAAELQRGVTGRCFGQNVEQEYVQARLAGNRVLVRVSCALGALLSFFCIVRKGLDGTLSHGQTLQISLVLLGSVGLASIAFTPMFDRLYLPLARIIVPVRNVLAAAFITTLAAQGQSETLMALPLMVVGPFFLLGLPFRAAFISVAAMIASFVISATITGLAVSTAVFSFLFLSAVTVACIVAARHLDRQCRKSFLESRRIMELAEHDALTGVKNRRVFEEQLDRLWQRAVTERRNLAMLLIDVDHFKVYNDRYGHQAGDRALCRVAQTLQTFVSHPLDVLARYGGEEFAVVLNDVDGRQAGHLAERMRRAVSELAVEQRHGASGRITISVGVAALKPSAERGPRGALQLADQAMYEAKVQGRNRVALMEDRDYRLLVTGIFSRNTFPTSGDTPSASNAGMT